MVFNSELVEMKTAFRDLVEFVDARTYKYEVMLAFWLAIELDKVEEAQALVTIDPLLERVVLNLRENGHVMRKA